MPGMKNARRSEAGVIQRAGGLFTTYDSRTSCKMQLIAGLRFERLIERLHRLGPRPTAELLAEIAIATGQHAIITDRLQAYAALDGDTPGRDAAIKLANRANDAGWCVRVMDCPTGHDWNDLAQKVAA